LGQIRDWTVAVLLALLGAMTIEVFGTFYRSIMSDSHPLVPKTLHTLWEVGFIIGVVLLLRRFRILKGAFFVILLVVMLASSLLWSVLPDSWRMPEPRYLGIVTREGWSTHPGGAIGETEVYDFPLESGTLYRVDSRFIRTELAMARTRNAHVGLRPFLTWQSGLAEGFLPDYASVPEYRGPVSALSAVVLYITVGPVVLLEALIEGTVRHFPLLLLGQVVLFCVCKTHFWREMRDPPPN